MTIYAYFRKLIKSTSVMLSLKLPRVLKFTLAGREFHTLATLSAKKPVASTVVICDLYTRRRIYTVCRHVLWSC